MLDLRPGLEARGHRYRTRCDTETILHLYEEQGERVVEQLRGMFAFAIWDRPRRRLLLARDRLGIKPLYYAVTDRELLFASEIKALAGRRLHVGPAFNEAVLPEFLSTRFVSGDETFFQGVRKLLPGARADVVARRAGLGRGATGSCRPPRRRARRGTRRRRSDLRERLEAAVSQPSDERRAARRVPLRRHRFERPGGAGRARDDRDRSRRSPSASRIARPTSCVRAAGCAAHIGAEHHEVTVTPARVLRTRCPGAVARRRADRVPLERPALFRAAARARAREGRAHWRRRRRALLGYNRYRVTRWNARLGRPYWAVVPAGCAARVRGGRAALPASLGRVARRTFLALEPGIRGLYLENFAVFPVPLQRRLLLRPEMLESPGSLRHAVRYYDEAPAVCSTGSAAPTCRRTWSSC